MEAFIDFSEDELIEDGVLNQGVCVCARLFSVEEPSPALEREERRPLVGQRGSLGGEKLPELPVWIVTSATVYFFCSAGTGPEHPTTQKTLSCRR